LEINPDNDMVLYNRGLAKIESGQKEGGCSDLKKAGELGFTPADVAFKKSCQTSK